MSQSAILYPVRRKKRNQRD